MSIQFHPEQLAIVKDILKRGGRMNALEISMKMGIDDRPLAYNQLQRILHYLASQDEIVQTVTYEIKKETK